MCVVGYAVHAAMCLVATVVMCQVATVESTLWYHGHPPNAVSRRTLLYVRRCIAHIAGSRWAPGQPEFAPPAAPCQTQFWA